MSTTEIVVIDELDVVAPFEILVSALPGPRRTCLWIGGA
jgi:hypothetical protein